MAGITLAQAEAQLAAWLEASIAVSKGQSYSVAGRSVTRADLSAISAQIDKWERRVQQLQGGSSGGGRVRHGVLIT